MKIILSIFLLLASYQIYSQELLREPKEITLILDASNNFTFEVGETPYLIDESIVQIYPGEVVFIEVETSKKKIKSMKVVPENVNPEKTLVFDFSQKMKGNVHYGMQLRIVNPFGYKLYFKTEVIKLDGLWQEMAAEPAAADLVSFQVWPDFITTLNIFELKFK